RLRQDCLYSKRRHRLGFAAFVGSQRLRSAVRERRMVPGWQAVGASRCCNLPSHGEDHRLPLAGNGSASGGRTSLSQKLAKVAKNLLPSFVDFGGLARRTWQIAKKERFACNISC